MFKLYVARFTIDGVEHTFSGYAVSKAEAVEKLGYVVSARNANIPGEDTKLGVVEFGVTPEYADKVAKEVAAKNPNGTVATDLHPDAANLLLHNPVNPNAEVRDLSRDDQ
jgi:hypothetical protein